jgi:hypothetical protein
MFMWGVVGKVQYHHIRLSCAVQKLLFLSVTKVILIRRCHPTAQEYIASVTHITHNTPFATIKLPFLAMCQTKCIVTSGYTV